MQPFCDWISITQTHSEPLPVVHGGFCNTFDQEGKHEYTVTKFKQHEGSFSTSCSVRCDGQTVTVSGNVGRLNRPDNLFGFAPDRALRLACDLAESYGLPRFTEGHRVQHTKRDGSIVRAWSGARITRIDITANFTAGSDSLARRTIGALGNWSRRRMVKGMSTGESVYWRNTREMLKIYVKAAEMKAHKSESPWLQWVKETGIVRIEMELKSRALEDIQCRYLGDFNMGKVTQLFNDRTNELLSVNQAIDHDLIENVPSRSRLYLDAWLRGSDLRATLSQCTFKRHRAALRKHGIDIAVARNIQQLPVKLEPIVLRSACPPEGYWSIAA